ncbi:MAG: NUDIX domain-containing protein [Bacilli bacterium]|nr:NUDIX domain-containing protein [Bacilli bacterium]
MRHFCASAFVIDPLTKKILLVFHTKFKKWVQPGGHIENDEYPEETVRREVFEETGYKIELLGERFPREDDFIKPLGIQNNRGSNGEQHIDIIYAARPLNRVKVEADDEIKNYRWFTREELEHINVFDDIKITMDYILKEYI